LRLGGWREVEGGREGGRCLLAVEEAGWLLAMAAVEINPRSDPTDI